MTTLVTLAEAASYLGVSKATLRNWDKEGKLKAHRHPVNRYRAYDLDELRQLKTQTSLLEEPIQPSIPQDITWADQRTVRRIVARLHAILRDTDGDSSIVQRFDELTKLIYLKLIAEKSEGESIFNKTSKESMSEYSSRIRQAYSQLAKQHPEVIPAQFTKLKCSDDAIYGCGIALSRISFVGANFDVKGVAYEEVIRGTFDKSDNQQFFTPHQVVSFMVAFMKPFINGTVCDPACGTAGFLAEVARSHPPYKKLLGIEIDERLKWVAGINLLLHGASKFEIQYLTNGGTLGDGAEPFMETCDAIITNPPFGSDYSDLSVLKTYELGQGKTSRRRGILFVERCRDLLKEKGYLAIVIDEGVLNLSSAQDVRKFILDNFEILGIVSLPETAFMPYATVNASILFLRKVTKGGNSKNVFFAKAETIGRKGNGDDDITYSDSGTSRPNSDLPEILQLWESHLSGQVVAPSKMAFTANVTENLRNDESLRLDFQYHHPSRNTSKTLLDRARHPILSLADLCEERNDSVIPSSEMADQVILYTGLANIESNTGIAHQIPTPAASIKSAVKRYEQNDIIFARMRPNLKKVALMSFPDGGYTSPECSVLTVRNGPDKKPIIDPVVLAAVLRSDFVFGQIMHLVAGIGRPRLNVTDLRKVRIPIPPSAAQREARRAFEGSLESANQLRTRATELLREAELLRLNAVEKLSTHLIDRQGD